MKHDDFNSGEENKELYCLERWLKIEKEGEKDYFFEPVASDAAAEEERNEIPQDLQNVMARFGSLTAEESALARNNFENIDDDNAPVEENLPTSLSGTGAVYNSEWGHDGTCPRRMSDARNNEASLSTFPAKTTKPTHL